MDMVMMFMIVMIVMIMFVVVIMIMRFFDLSREKFRILFKNKIKIKAANIQNFVDAILHIVLL